MTESTEFDGSTFVQICDYAGLKCRQVLRDGVLCIGIECTDHVTVIVDILCAAAEGFRDESSTLMSDLGAILKTSVLGNGGTLVCWPSMEWQASYKDQKFYQSEPR